MTKHLKNRGLQSVPLTREHYYVKLLTGRFSDLRPTETLLPIHKSPQNKDLQNSGTLCLRFPLKSGSDAHSGATVADFNRVPFRSIQKFLKNFQACWQVIIFSKNSKLLSNQLLPCKKIYFFIASTRLLSPSISV